MTIEFYFCTSCRRKEKVKMDDRYKDVDTRDLIKEPIRTVNDAQAQMSNSFFDLMQRIISEDSEISDGDRRKVDDMGACTKSAS